MVEFDVDEWRQALSRYDIRVAFFDIDGTLLNHDGHYSERLQRAMAATHAARIKTAIASGRPPYAARFLFDELNITDAGVFYTGALVYEPASGAILQASPLSAADVEQLIRRARQLGVYTEVCLADHYCVENRPLISQVHSRHLRVEPVLGTFDALDATEPVLKLLFAVDEQLQPGLLQQLEAEFAHLTFAYACLSSHPHWSFVSVIAPAACKQLAFQRLLAHYGVGADQVLSFGDADSDRDFLQQAGLGVAMGNAKPDIKAIADRVTVSAADDGVARVLELLVETR